MKRIEERIGGENTLLEAQFGSLVLGGFGAEKIWVRRRRRSSYKTCPPAMNGVADRRVRHRPIHSPGEIGFTDHQKLRCQKIFADENEL